MLPLLRSVLVRTAAGALGLAALSGPQPHADGTRGAAPPQIRAFAAATPVVYPGQSVTLSWEVRGAESVELEGLGPVTGDRARVTPQGTTDFRLRARGAGGECVRTLTVRVYRPETASDSGAGPGDLAAALRFGN